MNTSVWAGNVLRRRRTKSNVDLDNYTAIGRLIGATAFQFSAPWSAFRSADLLMESEGLYYFSCVTKAGEKQLLIAKKTELC
jgi:hypothetical protein